MVACQGGVLVGGDTGMCTHCVDDGAEDTPLWRAKVHYGGVQGPVSGPERQL